MVGIHHNFLFIGVLEGFDPRQQPQLEVIFWLGLQRVNPSDDVNTLLQPEEVSPKDVHEHCLCNVICIVSCDHFVCLDLMSPSVQCLSPEHSTESAVVALVVLACLLFFLLQSLQVSHYLIHGPAIQVSVGYNEQRQSITDFVVLHCGQ